MSLGFDAAGILSMLAVPALIAALGIALLGRHGGHLLLHLGHGLVDLGVAAHLVLDFPEAGSGALGPGGG